jgi:hypothetical protein
MSLSTIASKLDAVLVKKDESVQEETIDGRVQALDLLRYIFTKELTPDAGSMIGEALEAGSLAVEVEEGLEPGTVSIEALRMLESITSAFRKALIERMGSDAAGRPDMTPADFAVNYYMAHGMFPPAADKATVAAALRKLSGLPKK